MSRLYNFKQITVVPSGKDMIDVVLSMTQRKTPTVVHKQFAIARIRHFYMRKVKFTGANYMEKLQLILSDFPRLDDIHPFYADLMNILYDRDHYKLALGQVNTARGLIERLAKDYVRLLKYGDSAYRCKQLKRAGMGRMCTIVRRLHPSLVYLEQVRQHLARLPSIDPSTRTLLVCGYPNVGKSSFINKVTRANVEVQNYPFTTKSLYVGHMDYKYLRWQVIDTPGILDHELEQRNTIEMQSITALAHLRAAILYFLDVSEECGFSIAEQLNLFDSISPLFEGKPLIVVVNKIDLKSLKQCPAEVRQRVEALATGGVRILEMSNKTEEGVMGVRNQACDLLLEQRVTVKMRTREGALDGLITVTEPQARDARDRPVAIPQSVLLARSQMDLGADVVPKRRTQKDAMLEGGGAGVYSADFRAHWLLADDDWAHDVVPEIMDGKNIAGCTSPSHTPTCIMIQLTALTDFGFQILWTQTFSAA
jgi:nucleolar GTP-binding protein